MTLLEAALGYADRGWSVIPLEPTGKAPMGRLVPHGLKQASKESEQIRRWWATEPNGNIGLRTGIAFDALDVDKGGWGPLAGLVAEHGCLSIGPVSLTPGDGAHYLYRATGCGNRARFVAGADWRGSNGYIVGPPSIHPNGGTYEWAISPDEAEVVAAPPWLVDLLARRPEAAPTSSIRQVNTTYGQRALEAECGRVVLAPEGERNDTLNRAAFSLGQLIAGGALDADQAATALLIAAARCGLEETEARRTVASGFRAGSAQPRRVAS